MCYMCICVYLFSVYYFVFVCVYCCSRFWVFLCTFFLQYFDTVGWIMWPVKTVSHIDNLYCVGGYVKHCSIQPITRPYSFILFLSIRLCIHTSVCQSHSGIMSKWLNAECQSARMSKITIDSFTRYGTGCFIAVPMWKQWASKG